MACFCLTISQFFFCAFQVDFENLTYCLDYDFGKKIDHDLDPSGKRRGRIVIDIVCKKNEVEMEYL